MRIELKNVVVERQGRRCLDGIDLTIADGQTLGVLGPSGSGVSLLLKAAAGLLDPTEGQVLYDGVDLRSLSGEERRRLQTRTGFMFQDAALWANTNLLNNLLWPLQARHPGRPAGRLREDMGALLERVGFNQDLTWRPDRLSLGQQRFVSFLRAILPGPEALFLDEPHISMDSRWTRILDRETERLSGQGATVILGSHRAADWCDETNQLIILDRGRITHSGPPGQVRQSLPSLEVEPW